MRDSANPTTQRTHWKAPRSFDFFVGLGSGALAHTITITAYWSIFPDPAPFLTVMLNSWRYLVASMVVGGILAMGMRIRYSQQAKLLRLLFVGGALLSVALVFYINRTALDGLARIGGYYFAVWALVLSSATASVFFIVSARRHFSHIPISALFESAFFATPAFLVILGAMLGFENIITWLR